MVYMSNHVKKNPLQSEIIRYIQNYISENDLKQGDKLPSQAQLVDMIGVSRTALREALKTLEAKGVLEILNGKGIYIAGNHVHAMQVTLDFTEQKENLLELVEIRRALEREVLRLVVQKASDDELKALGQVKDVLLAKYYRGENQTPEDKLFHNMIYEMSHNKNMQKIIVAIQEGLDVFWNHPLNMKDPFTETIPLHGDLYDALIQRNIKKAQLINDEIMDRLCKDIQNNA